MADENDKQKEPDYKMSPDTEAGLKKALGAGGVLGDSADALFGGIKSAAESTGRVEQLKQKQAETLAKGELGASRAFADTSAKQFEAMKAARGEMPKRDIEEHTMQGLIGLGALLPMAGAMLGNKGLASGTGAMQAMAGLFTGYKEGNKERIAFEQKRYDDQMKQWENHARQLESDFRNAIEIAKTNMQAGHDAAKLAAVKAGAPMIAAMVDQQGALKTLEVIEKTITQTMSYDAAIKKSNILQQQQNIQSVGPFGATSITEQSPEKAAETKNWLSSIKLDASERNKLDNAKLMRDESEKVATMIAKDPDAVGLLATMAQKAEPIFGSFRDMSQFDTAVSNQLTEYAKENPNDRELAQRAAVMSKMLQSLSLKDAAATGRPTVFLERMTGGWYKQSYGPDTLIDIIRERANESDQLLKNYKLDVSRNRPEVNEERYPLLSKGTNALIQRYGKKEESSGIPSYTDQNVINKDLKEKGYQKGQKVKVNFNGEVKTWEVD
jgi:hypothetical protein